MMLRLLLVVIAVSGCGRRDHIVVGAKNFTESDLLAEIVAQQIERRTGLPIERRLHLGGTFVCDRAIKAGDIDLYVEYTGTALTAVFHEPISTDAGAAFDTDTSPATMPWWTCVGCVGRTCPRPPDSDCILTHCLVSCL